MSKSYTEYRSVKALDFKVCSQTLEDCLITGDFNPLIVLMIRIFSSPKNLMQSFSRDVKAGLTNVYKFEKMDNDYTLEKTDNNNYASTRDIKVDDIKTNQDLTEDYIKASVEYNQKIDQRMYNWYSADDPLFRRPLTIDFYQLNKCLTLLFSPESVLDLGIPKLAISCLIEALVGLSLNLDFELKFDKNFKPTYTTAARYPKPTLNTSTRLTLRDSNIPASFQRPSANYLTNYLERTNYFDRLDAVAQEDGQRRSRSPVDSNNGHVDSTENVNEEISSEAYRRKKLIKCVPLNSYLTENTLFKSREYANVFIIVFSLLPVFFRRKKASGSDALRGHNLDISLATSTGSEDLDASTLEKLIEAEMHGEDIVKDENDDDTISLLECEYQELSGIARSHQRPGNNVRLSSHRESSLSYSNDRDDMPGHRQQVLDSYLTFVHEGLPPICSVLANLPPSFKARLVKIFAVTFDRSAMSIIVKSLHTMIGYKIANEFYNDRKYVNDDKVVVNGVKSLEIFYYASLVAGEMSSPYRSKAPYKPNLDILDRNIVSSLFDKENIIGSTNGTHQTVSNATQTPIIDTVDSHSQSNRTPPIITSLPSSATNSSSQISSVSGVLINNLGPSTISNTDITTSTNKNPSSSDSLSTHSSDNLPPATSTRLTNELESLGSGTDTSSYNTHEHTRNRSGSSTTISSSTVSLSGPSHHIRRGSIPVANDTRLDYTHDGDPFNGTSYTQELAQLTGRRPLHQFTETSTTTTGLHSMTDSRLPAINSAASDQNLAASAPYETLRTSENILSNDSSTLSHVNNRSPYRRTSSSTSLTAPRHSNSPSTLNNNDDYIPSGTATSGIPNLMSLIWKDISAPAYTRTNRLEARLTSVFAGQSSCTTKHPLLPISAFVNKSLERVLIIERDYLDFRFPKHIDHFAFLNHPFVLSTEFKQKALQLDNRIRMYDERRVVYLQNLLQGFSYTPPFLKFRVRRNNLIQDSLANLELLVEENPEYLKKQLIIEFEGETGHDQGGLSKEFFQLIIEQIFNPDYGMFTYYPENSVFWFNSSSLETWSEYYLIGTIIGLSIYNSVILDVKFPLVLYTKLYGKPGQFEDLSLIYPDLFHGLNQLLNYPGDVAKDMETYFKINTRDVYGNIMEHELKPGGDSLIVTNENRQEYVELYADYLLNTSIEEQFSAFKRGFELVIDAKSPLYRLFTARELEMLICGNPVYDFDDFENATTYEGGYTRDSPTIRYFWNIVHNMNESEKRSLLRFTTGSDRIPLGGMANLKLVISKQGPDTDRLPTAHTCFNYLLLPEYATEDKLKNRLFIAISHAKGFGLI